MRYLVAVVHHLRCWHTFCKGSHLFRSRRSQNRLFLSVLLSPGPELVLKECTLPRAMVPSARVSPVESRGQDDDAFARAIFGELLAERSGVSKSCTLHATKHDELQKCV